MLQAGASPGLVNTQSPDTNVPWLVNPQTTDIIIIWFVNTQSVDTGLDTQFADTNVPRPVNTQSADTNVPRLVNTQSADTNVPRPVDTQSADTFLMNTTCHWSRDSSARWRFYSAHCRLLATFESRATCCRPVSSSPRRSSRQFLVVKGDLGPKSDLCQ